MNIVAHRGLHTAAPENSLGAIDAALEAGLDLIEVDVRATADGALVLMHDATLWRTTNAGGALSALRLDRLRRQVRLAGGAPVPVLIEAMERCRGRATLAVDVKEPLLAPAVIDLARSSGTDIEIWSEHGEAIAAAADRGISAALICNGLMPSGGIASLVDEARQLGARAVSFYPADLARSVTEACGTAGLMVMSGTPNDRPTWEHLRRLGVGRLITDRPLECRRWLNGVTAPVNLAETPSS